MTANTEDFKAELSAYLSKPEVIEAAALSSLSALSQKGPSEGFALFESRKANERPTAYLHADASPWVMWFKTPEVQDIFGAFAQRVGALAGARSGLSMVSKERHEALMRGEGQAQDTEFGFDLSYSGESIHNGSHANLPAEWEGAAHKFLISMIPISSIELNARAGLASDFKTINARQAVSSKQASGAQQTGRGRSSPKA